VIANPAGTVIGDLQGGDTIMDDLNGFHAVATTTLADQVGRGQVMDTVIRPLWPGLRLVGPAFTVRCPPGDNLMLHAAIYRAAPGDVLVVESGDTEYALCGGNVCAIAHRRGVAGLVADGLIRDLGETRDRGFPVFARGAIPFPGGKETVSPLNVPVRCAGVTVHPGDVVVADEEGVVVVPRDRAAEVLAAAQQKEAREAAESLDDWQAAHHARVEANLAAGGFTG
jgi:4-hydroxy-4-methyl-2-oxoglutarate aldolase